MCSAEVSAAPCTSVPVAQTVASSSCLDRERLSREKREREKREEREREKSENECVCVCVCGRSRV